MKKILITGAEGFIGKNLANFLELKGYIVDRFDKINSTSVLPDVSNSDVVIHLGANSSTTEQDLKKILNQNFEY